MAIHIIILIITIFAFVSLLCLLIGHSNVLLNIKHFINNLQILMTCEFYVVYTIFFCFKNPMQKFCYPMASNFHVIFIKLIYKINRFIHKFKYIGNWHHIASNKFDVMFTSFNIKCSENYKFILLFGILFFNWDIILSYLLYYNTFFLFLYLSNMNFCIIYMTHWRLYGYIFYNKWI